MNTLKVNVSGASNVNTGNLETFNAKVTASGASKVVVNVSDELKAKASGVSSVVNKAKAKVVSKKESGMASVESAN